MVTGCCCVVEGYIVCRYLQELVGGDEVFQPFVRKYFEVFAGSTVTTEQFANFFMQEFEGKVRSRSTPI